MNRSRGGLFMASKSRAEHFRQVKRLVVKVGTSLLADPRRGVNRAMIRKLAGEIRGLRRAGREVVVVTSGAQWLGRHRMGLDRRPKDMPGRQATAAVGQVLLMNEYERALGRAGLAAAQVLLTREDLENHQRYLNARNTLERLLEMGAVPVINENDTVAFEEIRFGDNDNLAALVAQLVQAQLLVILTDVDGLYEGDPRLNRGAGLIGVVPKITRAMEQAAGGVGSDLGTGGMLTKLQAAKVVTAGGEMMVIARGDKPRVLLGVLEGGEEGTLFLPSGRPLDSHKRWIAFGFKPRGALMLDEGAARALRVQGKSLLPSGVTGVSGRFGAGEVVRLVDPNGREIGRGLCNYSSEECGKIKGARSSEIEARLGYKMKDEMVHRNDMVLGGDPRE